MKRIAFVVVALIACGDNHAQPDGAVDTPPEATTLTAYVIDQITNHTAADTPARPFAEFATLPDPDGDNLAAYASLF